MNHKIVLITILFFSCLEGFSQKIISSNPLADKNDSLIAIYYMPVGNEVIKLITSQPINKGKATSGPYVGYEMISYPQSLVFADGFKIQFKNDESVIDIKENSILTEEREVINEGKKTIRYYHLLNRQMIEKAQTTLGLEDNIFLLNTGNVLVTDEFEGYGRSITFYNQSLKLISNDQPLKEERFVSSTFSEYGNSILFAIKPYGFQGIKSNLVLIKYDSNTGKLIQRIETLIDDVTPTNIKFNSAQIAFWGNRKMIGLNNEGQKRWSTEINLISVEMTLVNNGTCLVTQTEKGLAMLSMETGITLWSHSFSELSILKSSYDLSSVLILPLEIKPVLDNAKIAIVLGVYKKDDLSSPHPSFESAFILFNHDGIILNQQLNSNKSRVEKIVETKDKVFMLNDENIIIHEKN